MRLIDRSRDERGDTLVEVLFAFAVFAVVAVGSLTIMNQGVASAQRSLEITLVRQQMDAQAEAIRYVHQAYVAAYQKGVTPAPDTAAAQWGVMKSKGETQAASFNQINGATCPAVIPGQHPFILNARTAKVSTTTPTSTANIGASLPPYAQVLYNPDSSINQAYGIWVEAVPSSGNTNNAGFVDFHISACWDAPGGSVPATLGTIVRLYEPL